MKNKDLKCIKYGTFNFQGGKLSLYAASTYYMVRYLLRICKYSSIFTDPCWKMLVCRLSSGSVTASSLQTLPHPLCQTLSLFVLVRSPVSTRMYTLSILCDIPSTTYAVRSSFIKDLFFLFFTLSKNTFDTFLFLTALIQLKAGLVKARWNDPLCYSPPRHSRFPFRSALIGLWRSAHRRGKKTERWTCAPVLLVHETKATWGIENS